MLTIYEKECLNTIYNSSKDKKVIFIGSDLGPGVLSEFKKIPKDFYEGVEQSIIGLAGLAMDG